MVEVVAVPGSIGPSTETCALVVMDDSGAPTLDILCKAEPKRVVTWKPDLDLPGAMEELARVAGGSGPGDGLPAPFRRTDHRRGEGRPREGRGARQVRP